MTNINLYKINDDKIDSFIRFLSNSNSDYVKKGNDHSLRCSPDAGQETDVQYNVSLYYKQAENEKDLSWNWVLALFGEIPEKVWGRPSGFLLFANNLTNKYYVITFGSSFFQIDKYCDKSWAFDFAKRLHFQNFKIVALTSPASKLNKKINTYSEKNNDLDFGSGDALIKLKGNIVLDEESPFFKKTLEFGRSIKFSVDTRTLDQIIRIIGYVEDTIEHKDIIQKIPYYKQIQEKEKKNFLFQQLEETISTALEAQEPLPIDFSEFQICGTDIIFTNDDEISYKYHRKSTAADGINVTSLTNFMLAYEIPYSEFLNINIVVSEDGTQKYSKKVSEIISYIDTVEQILLVDGKWYEYNEDFMEYLEESITEIPVEYNSDMDYSKEKHEKYIDHQVSIQIQLDEYKNMPYNELKNMLSNKYYKERYFNELMVRDYGYTLKDRQCETVGSSRNTMARIEPMDLYNDETETMYTVKFGDNSSKLCYAVDQSLGAAKLIHTKKIFQDKTVKNVCIWIILTRYDKLPNAEDGKPDLNSLHMFLFKSRLDNWKKEIRQMGFIPLVRINYATP